MPVCYLPQLEATAWAEHQSGLLVCLQHCRQGNFLLLTRQPEALKTDMASVSRSVLSVSAHAN